IGHRAARAAGAGERCARACGRRSRFSSRALADEASDRICKNQRGTLMDERTTLLAADSVDTAAGDLKAEAIEQSSAAGLKSYLADLLDLRVDQVDEEMTFDRFGLDSLASVGMIADLGEWLGYEFDAAAPNDFPSIRSLARELAADEKARAAYALRFGK